MRFILALLSTVLLSSALFALEGHVSVREGYAFRNGKVVLMKEGKENEISAEVTLRNGARLLPDGIVVFKDGRREHFRDNMWLNLEGDFVAFDAGSDVAVVEEEYYLEGDKVYVMRDNRPVLLSVEVTLGNGSRLTPDGYIITREGHRDRLSAGQRIAKSGTFREHRGEARHNESRTPLDASHRETVERRNQPQQPPATTQPIQPNTQLQGTPAQPKDSHVQPRETPAQARESRESHEARPAQPAQPAQPDNKRENK